MAEESVISLFFARFSLELKKMKSSTFSVYDAQGKRKNTRAVRWRERYTAERQDTMEKIMKLHPTTASSTVQSNLLVRKRTKKIPIPIDQHPNYNFIGLIIGPRGKTQKELEAKTGCKIAIRGRGSVKEGARGRRDGKVMEGDNEPLHVVITGDDQRAVEAAADMVQQMLVVIDDEKNVHKQQQLRELALLNGTLKEDEYCTICAEKGHRAFECPRRFATNTSKNKPAVKCAICGDTSHPTRDCTQRPTEQRNQQELDSEYMTFMAELDGKKADTNNATGKPNNAGRPVQLPPPPPSAGGTNLPAPGASSNGGFPSTLPPPPVSLPPPAPPVHAPGLPPPPPPPAGLPPPPPPPLQQLNRSQAPSSLPPPPPGAGGDGTYYGMPPGSSSTLPPPALQQGYQAPPPPQQQQHSHPQHHQYPQQPYGQYPPQGYPQPQTSPSQQLGNNPQQQRRPSQVRAGEETQAWDPSSYYGGYDANGGAGGFNWWEQ